MRNEKWAVRFALFLTLTTFAAAVRAQQPVPAPPSERPPTDSVVWISATPAPVPRLVRVCAGGDVTLGTNLDTTWQRMGARRLRANFGVSDDPSALVAPLRPLFADADIVLVNVETAIGIGNTKTKCGPRSKNCFAFRGPPAAAAALRSLGDSTAVVVGNVANNHARDAGDIGVDSTIAHLTRAGVLVTGVDTLATPILLRDSVTVGVLGFYTAELPTNARDLAAVRRHVARAVEQYGTVIVTAHIGAEGIGAQRTRDSTELFLESRIDRGNPVAFATAALEGGATLVVGHGPHVLRAAEWRDDRLVLYSLGNLLTYGPFNNIDPINRGVVACADLAGRQVFGADLRPTIQLAPGVVKGDYTGRALVLIDSLSALDFPNTGVRVSAWGELGRARITVMDTAETVEKWAVGKWAVGGGEVGQTHFPLPTPHFSLSSNYFFGSRICPMRKVEPWRCSSVGRSPARELAR